MAKHHEALIYTMVLMAAVDRDMTDREMRTFGAIVQSLPVFADFDHNAIPKMAGACAELLTHEDGLDEAFAFIKDSLPPKLRETAYAIACEIVAADGNANQEELRLLEMVRHRLDIDRLIAAGIERGARARYLKA